MRKPLIVLLIIVLTIPMLFAQAQAEQKKAEVVQLILALSNPESDPWAQGTKKFAEELERISGGTMKVEYFFGGQLYNASNILAAVTAGKIDFTGFGMTSLPEAPYLGMFQAAYMFRDAQHAQDFYAGEIGQKIFDDIEKKAGMRLLDTAYVGTRQISLAKKIGDVKVPADLKGITLRMPPGASWAALAEAIGTNPVPIALNEVYMAMKTGAVDGQDNALPTTKANSFDEVTDQLVLTDHVVWNLHLACNAARWNSFTDQQKAWVLEAAAIGCDYTTESFKATEESLKKEFAAKGVRIVTPDKQAFMAYAENYYRTNTKVTETWNWEYFDALKK